MIEKFIQPSGWFYNAPVYTTAYSRDPAGGEPSIERLINGDPAFWKTLACFPSKPRKKTIVITDWSTREPSILLFLLHLIKFGFEVYRYEQNKIKRLFQKNVRDYENFENQKHSVSMDEVLQAMTEQGLPASADSILLLDYFLINQLFFAGDLEPIAIVRLDDFKNRSSEFYTQVLNSIRNDRVGLMIQAADQLTSYLYQFLERFKGRIVSFSDSREEPHSLSDLLNYFPQLEKLELSNCKDINEINLDEGFFFCLKTLHLSNSSITSDTLSRLLQHCPKLEGLCLFNCNEINTSLNLANDFCLRELKELTLNRSTPHETFGHLFTSCSNLEKLDLSNCEGVNGVWYFVKGFCLSRLKTLYLTGVSITSEALGQLLNNFPNLQKLILRQCIIDQFIPSADEFRLSKLKQLWLGGSSITSETLNMLLNRCHNLETINLSNCKIKEEVIHLVNEFHLNKLNFLDLTGLSITDDVLIRLLNYCPNLFLLNLSACRNINSLTLTLGNRLHHLKYFSYLDLSDTNINSKSLSNLLNCYPNLAYLNLDGCSNITQTISLAENVILKGLVLISYSSTIITSKIESNLRRACPGLGVRNCSTPLLSELLYHCLISKRIPTDFNINQNIELISGLHFPEMEELILDESQITITTESLLKLVRCFPNLKSLDIRFPNTININDLPPNALGKIKLITRPYQIIPKNKNDKVSAFSEKNFSQLDSITKSPKKPLDTRQYFLPKRGNDLHPRKYRLNVLTHVNLTKLILSKGAMNLKERDDFRTISIKALYAEYYQKYQNNPEVFLGQITLLMISGKEYALPSLSANEKIEALSYHPADASVTVSYSQEENLYYVTLSRSKHQGQEVTIGYLLHVPEVKAPNFPEEVTELIAEYNSFDETGKELKGITPSSSQSDILQAMKDQKKGACRHRTVGFMADLAKLPQPIQNTIKARAILNDCHAYVEISYNKSPYFGVDLGGSFARLSITPFVPLKATVHDRIQELPVVIEKQRGSQPLVVRNTHLTITRKLADKEQETLKNRIASISFSSEIIPPATISSFADYCSWLLTAGIDYSPTTPKALVIFNQESELIEFNLSLIRHLARHNKKFYFVDKLEDIYLKDLALEKNVALGQEFTIDSDLVRHIKEVQAGDMLIINWSDYESHHIGYNTLLDKERKLYNWPLAEGVIILNVLSTSKTKCMREDFYSRAGIRTTLPSWVPEKQEVICASCSNTYSVDLYHHQQWQRFLLGYFIPQGKQFVFHKGALLEALEKGYKGLLIYNAPTSGPLQLFCEGIEQTRSFTLHGKTYQLPNYFKLHFSTKEHDFNDCYTLIPFAPNIAFDYLLHSETLSYAFTTYTCQESKLYEQPGWLKQDQQQTIRLLVTENLPEDEWARLLDYAKHCKRHLNIILAPDILPPAFFNTKLASTASDLPLIPVTKLQNDKVAVILSQDGDLTAAKLARDLAAVVLPLARSITYADVVEGISLDDSKPIDISALSFHSLEGKLLSELKTQKTVIVKGNLSQALMARLSTLFSAKPFLWVNSSKVELTDMGRLLIVTEDPQAFSFVSRYQDPDKDCWPLLAAQFGQECVSRLQLKINAENKTYSYSQLCAMFQQLQRFPNKNIFKPFQRLDQPSPIHKKTNKNLNHVERRLQKIFRYLEYSPYVFIVGPSGVGKSDFVKKEVKKYSHLFVGMNRIKEWAVKQANDNKAILLFIDEANLERDGCFEFFEGLWCKPSHIIYQQHYYPLTAKHKVIFAGNYNSVEGRQQHAFFQRHGAVISFKPYSDVELKEIMSPILIKLMADLTGPDLKGVMAIFLKAYNRVNDKSKVFSLTARNLQMICLRLALY
jgi:hypothetical protein